jgi:hypothetical protein
VSLYFLDDVFLLHLAFETTKRIFEGFSLLKSDFCQTDYTPKLVQKDRTVIARLQHQVKRNVKIFDRWLKWWRTIPSMKELAGTQVVACFALFASLVVTSCGLSKLVLVDIH